MTTTSVVISYVIIAATLIVAAVIQNVLCSSRMKQNRNSQTPTYL